MRTLGASADYESALTGRLRAVAPALGIEQLPEVEGGRARDALALLELLIEAVRLQPTRRRIWLICAAVAAALPTADQVLDGVRVFTLRRPEEILLWLLDQAVAGEGLHAATRRIELVGDRVVVDVDHAARHDLHTGIQQVVRQTLPHWAARHAIVPVAWSESFRILRHLSSRESKRVLDWGGIEPAAPPDDDEAARTTLVVPWQTVVVLAEVPDRRACRRLAAVAEHSGNVVVAVGHDCVPVVSADMVPAWEPERFAQYLTVIKHARRVAGVSRSAAAEFAGFAAALPSQGLKGPTVITCLEAARSVRGSGAVGASGVPPSRRSRPRSRPLVVSVGSFEPRKNHLALVYAAERLWREGLDFELVLIGGSAWGDELPTMVAKLQARGRPITTRMRVSEDDLLEAYRAARFTVFPSLHEGYGLPVADSLSMGTPVITCSYGSTAEIGAGGGALLVDPRDDEAIVAAMRSLLADDAALQALLDAISHRPERTWEDYADELWDELVVPELFEAPEPLEGAKP